MARPYAYSILPLASLALVACSRDRGPAIPEPIGQTHTTSVTTEPHVLAVEESPKLEGRIAFSVGEHGGTTALYQTKGDKLRIVLESSDEKPRLDLVLDGSRGIATLLLDDKKQYALLDMATLARSAGTSTAAIGAAHSGTRLRIAGQDCEVWNIADGPESVRACVVTGAPRFDLAAIESTVGYSAPAWLRKLVAEGAVPLRVEILENGAPRLVTELTPLPIADTVFAAPEGFAKVAPR